MFSKFLSRIFFNLLSRISPAFFLWIFFEFFSRIFFEVSTFLTLTSFPKFCSHLLFLTSFFNCTVLLDETWSDKLGNMLCIPSRLRTSLNLNVYKETSTFSHLQHLEHSPINNELKPENKMINYSRVMNTLQSLMST